MNPVHGRAWLAAEIIAQGGAHANCNRITLGRLAESQLNLIDLHWKSATVANIRQWAEAFCVGQRYRESQDQ